MFGPLINRAILAYAEFYPNREVCGYISAVGSVQMVENIAVNPVTEWQMRPGAIPDDALAVFHSHPIGPACPSGEDMRFQIASGLPHGIATVGSVFWWGDGVPMLPLIGRAFRHGVTDCFELIRDAYQLAGVALDPIAREWKWWKAGESLYTTGFRPAGFVEIDSRDMLPGDCMLMTLPGSRIPNHAAIWLGGELILHHLSSSLHPYDPERLSCVEGYGRYGRYFSKAVRYENGYLDRTTFEEIRQASAAGYSITR